MAVNLPLLLFLGALFLLSATFSATEAAMLAVNKVRLRHLAQTGHHSAKLIYDLLPKMNRVIGTLLVGNNVVNVAISVVGSWICISLVGPESGIALATLLITASVLLIGEVAPKTFAANHAEVVMFAMVRPLRVCIVLLHPVASFFMWAARVLLRLLRIPTRKRSPLVTEEEIKVMIQMGREAGILDPHELRMLQRIFEFSDLVVKKVMMPRHDIAGINLSTEPEELLDVIIEQGHSRIPVYRETLDNVVGVIYARDLLAMIRHKQVFVLDDLIRPIAIVREDKRVAELLSEFQRDKTQISIVQDSRGSTIGVVTLEDLLEEIVGEIQEEIPGKKHGRRRA